MGAALLGVWAAASTCGSPATVAFDVHMVAAGAQTFRLTCPSGKRLVVVDDDVTISEIPGVEATVERVDDVNEDSAGPPSVVAAMTHPVSGTWRVEVSVRRPTGISLTATADTDSVCEAGDAIDLEASGSQAWRLEIGSGGRNGGCQLDLKRVKKSKSAKNKS